MSRLAIKEFCRRQMALLDVPAPCAVLTQRPKAIGVGEQAVIVVGVPASKEERLTLGRGSGRKRVDHQVRLDVYWLAADEQDGGDEFDGLLEQIDGIFRSVTIPAGVQDPATGASSVVVWIGEEIETAVDEPVLDGSLQGLVGFSARKTLLVTEHVTG